MPKRETLVRENRLRGLTAIAVDLLNKGVDDYEVEQQLREVALNNWGVSPATIYNYAAVALARAKKQLAQQRGGGVENADSSQ